LSFKYLDQGFFQVLHKPDQWSNSRKFVLWFISKFLFYFSDPGEFVLYRCITRELSQIGLYGLDWPSLWATPKQALNVFQPSFEFLTTAKNVNLVNAKYLFSFEDVIKCEVSHRLRLEYAKKRCEPSSKEKVWFRFALTRLELWYAVKNWNISLSIRNQQQWRLQPQPIPSTFRPVYSGATVPLKGQ